MSTKYIFITGGVVSSLGKGITAASLGCLLKNRGLNVSMQKLDPYINVDPGTMSPYQHGEVFVTEDGAETDLDLGHYERFIDINLTEDSSLTAGKVYWSVLNKERRGDYRGDTVQVIPHITNEIKHRIKKVAANRNVDVVITEIGGTVGDIESLPFLEAIRQLRHDAGRSNVLYIHVTLVPYLTRTGELKTKPTQHSVKELRGIGIQPDIIVCRTEHPLTRDIKEKIALFCNVEPEAVVQNHDVSSIYDVPLLMKDEGLDDLVMDMLGLRNYPPANMGEWKDLIARMKNPKHSIKIALIGKYVELHDAYLSVAEALNHGAIANDAYADIKWIHSAKVNSENIAGYLRDADGVIIPGGFGNRGIEGKIQGIKYAREKALPLLGIGLGMQLLAVEFSQNVLGLKNAHSTEFRPKTPYPIIDILYEKKDEGHLNSTMRLGLFPCELTEGTKAHKAYGTANISERHRHRYGFNNEYRDMLSDKGLIISGTSEGGDLAEIVELRGHPWFIGCQFHPEFKSRPNRAHPLFDGFIKAMLQRKD